jgi:hypothetical protein
MTAPPRDDEGAVCNQSTWNAVADQPHQRGFARAFFEVEGFNVHSPGMAKLKRPDALTSTILGHAVAAREISYPMRP